MNLIENDMHLLSLGFLMHLSNGLLEFSPFRLVKPSDLNQVKWDRPYIEPDFDSGKP